MTKRVILASTLIFTLGISSLFSQELPGKRAVLSELIQEALDQNPQIKAAQKEWEAALEKIPQVKSLPDPMFSYSYFGKSIETRLGPQRNKISLSQKLPFFGKLAIKGEIARRGSSISAEKFNAVRADITLKVKKAFYSLFWFDRAIKISQEEKDVLKRLARIAGTKYETGGASQQDILKAQLEISKISDKLLILNQGRRAVVAELNSRLNRPPDYPVGEAETFQIPELRVDLEQLYAWAREMRPELRKAQFQIEENEENLRLAKKNYFPDLNIMVDYIDIGGGTTTHTLDGRNSWMASIGINIPLWRKKLHAAKTEAALKIKASEDYYKNVENETTSRINELFFEIKTAQEQVDLYKYSLLPQAEQSLKASEVGYLAGKVDFLNLLDSERMILMIKNGYFKVLSDLGKSLTQLERVVGKQLINIHQEDTSRH